VTYDHHAFLYWPATSLAVLPVQVNGFAVPITCGPPPCLTPLQPAEQSFTGALAFRVGQAGIEQLGQIVQDSSNGLTPVIERSLVVGDQLFTVSQQGVMASSLDTLARQAFASFPT
jgi:hypothetical protein